MKILFFLISLWIFIKTISYGIYEIKNNNNKTGGISVIFLAVVSVVFPNIVLYFFEV